MNEHTEVAMNLKSLRGVFSDPLLEALLVEMRGFAALLQRYGTEVAIDSPLAREAWFGLNTEAKEKIVRQFSLYHRNCQELHASGVSLRDNRAFVKHCLAKAKLFAKDPVEELLQDNYMIEGYNLSNIQIFRSINFFDYCNYSLLDLLAREWMSLYERLSSVTEALFKEIYGSVTSKEFRYFQTPAHIMKERDASPSGIFRTEVVYCCPLYSGPELTAGYLLALKVDELDLLPQDHNKVTFLR